MTIHSFQEMLESIECLSEDDQDDLFELIRKRRIEKRWMEIADQARQMGDRIRSGDVKIGSVDDLLDDLLSEDE